ncbi:MAG: tRNA (adenosine(37)-N6)-threonylcarbamoyltransferase complex ATPase subunit type 1 TsaE [bacterium]
MPKIEITTKNEQETRKTGELLAKELQGGETLCLQGDLGSGKTTFVQGLARGLGIKQWPTSPTFVIIKEYKNLYHIDCYRINKNALLKLDFKKILKSDKIKAIEWADKIKDILPKNKINIKFDFVDEKTRKIIIN